MNLLKGRFVDRVNRFVTRVEVDGKIYSAYLPNPGRLWELLLPEREVILVPNFKGKFPFTLVATFKDRFPVLLHTHWTNRYVKDLLLGKKIPGLEEYRIKKEEPGTGGGRLDFLLEGKRGELFLEVKTCTLFGEKVAMFPDAITERGRRHLYELQKLKRKGYQVLCLFVVMSPKVRYFLPAYHVDPGFTKAFLETYREVKVQAISVRLSSDLSLMELQNRLEIPLEFVKREVHGRRTTLSVFIVSAENRKDSAHKADPSGYYLYLQQEGVAKGSFPPLLSFMPWRKIQIVSRKDLKKSLEKDLARVADHTIAYPSSFRSSSEQAKLFFFQTNPFHREDFVKVLEEYLLEKPGERIVASLKNHELEGKHESF
jgi:sugar fermentation stimulation protein A